MTTSTPLSVASQGSGLSVRASSRSRRVTRGMMWGKVVLVSGGPSAERGTLRTQCSPKPLHPPPHLPWLCEALVWPHSPAKPGCCCAPGRGFKAQLQHSSGCGSSIAVPGAIALFNTSSSQQGFLVVLGGEHCCPCLDCVDVSLGL